ncbi:MAG TPA: hypothetical protein VJH33_00315 [Candidatus Paceibacterota bacterium]
MTIRYFRQRGRFDCGPIVILNALKWAGAPLAYRSLKKIRAHTHYSRLLGGTKARDISKTLHALGATYFTIRTDKHPRIEKIAKHVEHGGAVVLCYQWRKKEDWNIHKNWLIHIVLIIGMPIAGKKFRIANYPFTKTTLYTISRSLLCNDLRTRKDPTSGKRYPIAWYLKRKKVKHKT